MKFYIIKKGHRLSDDIDMSENVNELKDYEEEDIIFLENVSGGQFELAVLGLFHINGHCYYALIDVDDICEDGTLDLSEYLILRREFNKNAQASFKKRKDDIIVLRDLDNENILFYEPDNEYELTAATHYFDDLFEDEMY